MRSASLQYANVLADIALEQGAAEPAAKQLSAFGAVYAESAELRTFLASPAVTIEVKHAVIEKIIARMGASKILRNFLFVIADHRRTPLIPEIIATFQQRAGGNPGSPDGQENRNKVFARSGVAGRRGRADRGHDL